MVASRSTLRLITLITALVVLCAASAHAQVAETSVDYPTVAALDEAVLPPRDRVELARRLRGVTDIPPTPTSAVTRQVGEKQTFTVINTTDNTSFDIRATLRVVGEHIYLWVESGAAMNDADLQALAHDFDTFVYPRVRALWGSEANPGVDGDPRIYGVFAHDLGTSTVAYFYSDHTYPKAVVPFSNEHEMFFFNLDTLGSNIPLLTVDSVISHEFQHMIRANQQVNTETWLNEGLSEFTQYYLYDQLDSSILSFLDQPNTQLNSWNSESGGRAANYGAASLFLIYFYQHYGTDAMRALSADHSPRGLQAVDDVLRASGKPGVDDVFADWVLANYLFDSTYDGGRYGYPELPPLFTPTTTATAAQYPFDYDGEANQYATDYFVLSGLGGAQSLDLNLSAPASVGLIPTSASSGVHFWYSNRGDMADSRLTRPFDLTGVSHATLDYRLWYDTEALWDYGYVMVSDDDGASWHILPTAHTTESDPHGLAFGPGYSGTSGGWIDESLSLDAYAGKPVLVRFEMITDDAVTRPGMALDDVRVPEIGYAEDFEEGTGDWQAQGWLWTDNRLPEHVWVQAAQRIGTTTAAVDRWQSDDTAHRIDLAPGVDQVIVAISPFAPLTTVSIPYMLTVQAS